MIDHLRKKWFARGKIWQKSHPWLDVRIDTAGNLGCGCLCCATAAPSGTSPWSQFKITNVNSIGVSLFKRHEMTAAHKECSSPQSGDASGLAPSQRECEEVMFALHSGQHKLLSQGPDDPDRRKHFRKMTYCLAEARRNQVRSALRDSLSASVQQDVRKAQLLVRITSCDSDLNVTSAPLGQCNMAESGFGLSAQGVRNSTQYIMDKFCTPELHIPGNTRVRAADDLCMDEELLKTIRDSVSLFAADGAADEQLAGELMKTDVFPQLVMKMRDQCHGVKRVLSRTWPSDPVLRKLASDVVLDNTAIVQRIRFSEVFTSRFAKYVRVIENVQASRGIKDLASAKHRYTSHSRPFGRACLYLEALVRTAQSILDERGKTSPEGRDAAAFLMSLDDESIILLGMMADVADETMVLNRFFDQDHFDKSVVATEVNRFLQQACACFCLHARFDPPN